MNREMRNGRFRLLAAEHLKMKRTFAGKLIWLCPVILVVMAFFMMGTYLYQCAYNMWYCFFVPMEAALLCALIHQKEEKQLKYYRVLTSPVRLQSIWYSKVLLATIYLLASGLVFCLLVCGVTKVVLAGATVSFGAALAAVAVTVVCSLWQIPFYLWLGKKGGFFLPVAAALLGCVLETVFAVKTYWWVCPYAWASRLMCTVLGVLPNGLLAEDSSMLVGWPVILGTMACGAALYLLITWVTGILFGKEVK